MAIKVKNKDGVELKLFAIERFGNKEEHGHYKLIQQQIKLLKNESTRAAATEILIFLDGFFRMEYDGDIRGLSAVAKITDITARAMKDTRNGRLKDLLNNKLERVGMNDDCTIVGAGHLEPYTIHEATLLAKKNRSRMAKPKKEKVEPPLALKPS